MRWGVFLEMPSRFHFRRNIASFARVLFHLFVSSIFIGEIPYGTFIAPALREREGEMFFVAQHER